MNFRTASMLFALALSTPLAAEEPVTVLWGEQAHRIEGAAVREGELLVPATELARVNGFELKDEGLCAGAICIPLRDEWLVQEGEARLFNATRFAAHLKQPVAAEPDARVFSFGPVPQLASGLAAGEAPDFALPDRTGKTVRLSDFRGKKVLLLAWASW